MEVIHFRCHVVVVGNVSKFTVTSSSLHQIVDGNQKNKSLRPYSLFYFSMIHYIYSTFVDCLRKQY